MISFGLLFVLLILLSLNMGGSNFGASFAAAYGSGNVTKKSAHMLYVVFVFLGAIFLGKNVSDTLGNRIISAETMNIYSVIVIIASATLCLFLANLIQVPQSTSLVTVASILGVGAYYKSIYFNTFYYFVPFWILLPLAGYILTYFFGSLIYPPRASNFWVYEKIINHNKRIKAFLIGASCYNAFSVGANNVANAIGPLAGAGLINTGIGLAFMAPVFGLGSYVFSKTLDTTAKKIVPIGMLTATIICLVTGTLMIIASVLGIPQSFVMIQVAAVLAISGLKNGHKLTFMNPVTKKVYISWILMPIVAFIIAYSLSGLNEVVLR